MRARPFTVLPIQFRACAAFLGCHKSLRAADRPLAKPQVKLAENKLKPLDRLGAARKTASKTCGK
jgi:hypothetical protein